MLPVLTITLNPALDLTTSLDHLAPARKLRCGPVRLDAGGGGVNVSRAIKELGGESRAFVAIGGHTGAQFRAILDRTGIEVEYWPLIEETRTSFTVMETASGQPYRFVLPGPRVSPAEANAILDRIAQRSGSHRGFVVASGSLPPGIPDDFYGGLACRCRELGARLIVDSHGAALRAAAAERPYLIRLNHLEAQELLGGDSQIAAHTLARELVDTGLAEAAIVTVGERGAIVASAGRQIEIRPPRVEVKSGVGAGDSFVAALTFGLAKGWDLEDAARYGVAAAAAAVITEATELCKRDTVDTFFAAIGGQLRPAA
jgi:6-phosphofructokinase 2